MPPQLGAAAPAAPRRADRANKPSLPRSRALACAAVFLAAATVLLFASPANAQAPIPGSPLDAYDQHTPYDPGVHKLARLAALISYTLIVSTVLLGTALRLRHLERFVNRTTMYGAHMTIALSALIFGAIHGVTFLYQPIWHIGTSELVIPFTSGPQRLPVGFGILGTELAIAVGCSVWLQRRLGYHRWLRFHQLGYAAFTLIWLHVFTVHPEPRHVGPVAVTIAVGAGLCLLAFLTRAIPPTSRLRASSLRTNLP
ncbi:hypothetical protein F7Q99_28915 [Streptomyces kaniharaensis]|uniref:Ferric oxidoreductase domain-containing protein n=1 Tax=Streptomyces kaniharaensis TaxID=212423 RepID=A0A6N7L2W6_9ACTN|nr:ferric reductase-like transmembrane domain-containing protein [Streptomyces kaniharaensis]MQS16143.1 hypothetical protein [Streptomyces kaniharaensis]